MKVLLWDIDGTLLNTDRAGLYAWMQAAEEIHGGPLDASGLSMAGMTDPLIADITVNDLMDREGQDDIAPRLLERYLELLPEWLPRRSNGFIQPNVLATLETLAPHSDFEHALLTGNIERGGRGKLAHHGILDFFVWGAFADDEPIRRDIARNARAEAERRHGPKVELFVIGDTRHDIDCGRAVGAKTIAVATGGATIEELEDHDPWWLLEHLPEPTEFIERLERA
jgi:phosphoglycolate phosphatase-like HAD superfamily hydrolase